MDEHRLTQLLRLSAAEISARTRFCPDDQAIVRYFEGLLAEPERSHLKRHLLDCRFCLAQIGNLERMTKPHTGFQVAEAVIADAKRLAAGSSPKPARKAPLWATAAVVIIAAGIALTRHSPGPDEITPSAALPALVAPSGSQRESRNINTRAAGPQISAPAEGTAIDPDSFVVHWSDIPGALYYDVRIVTEDGGLVSRQRVRETWWEFPGELGLTPGNQYYVRVDAYLAEAKSLSSHHVAFRIDGQR